MDDEYEEQVLEPEDVDEGDYIDSIGMLELLARPGKAIGQCRFIVPSTS